MDIVIQWRNIHGYMDTVEKFYIYRETANGNQLNDKRILLNSEQNSEAVLRGEGCLT
jgi:hypothetical protein